MIRTGRRDTRLRRLTVLGACAVAVLILCAVSLSLGSNAIPVSQVWSILLSGEHSDKATIIWQQRVPRTILILCVGAALGVAGALMQSLTRNPLADPGLLGINAGASLAVVLSVAFLGQALIWNYMWFAFLGAALAAVAVHSIAGVGGRGITPGRLALAGIAISMAVQSLVQTVILGNQDTYNEFRFWASGSVEGRGYAVIFAIIGFIVVGLIIAIFLASALNAMALGDDTGKALGVNVQRVRTLVLVAVTLLAGAGTAAAGPILFIGLGVPYLARALCGPDQRWVIPVTAVTAPGVLLVADIFARLVVAPQEVPVGVVSAILGGPIFVYLVRRPRIEAI